MSALLVKNFPDRLRRKIKGEAKRNRRSMAQKTVVLLDEAVRLRVPARLPRPVKPKHPIDHEWLLKAMKEGRT